MAQAERKEAIQQEKHANFNLAYNERLVQKKEIMKRGVSEREQL
jgi:hypothetical protein